MNVENSKRATLKQMPTHELEEFAVILLCLAFSFRA
jgi:hypothetical protein